MVVEDKHYNIFLASPIMATCIKSSAVAMMDIKCSISIFVQI